MSSVVLHEEDLLGIATIYAFILLHVEVALKVNS